MLVEAWVYVSRASACGAADGILLDTHDKTVRRTFGHERSIMAYVELLSDAEDEDGVFGEGDCRQGVGR